MGAPRTSVSRFGIGLVLGFGLLLGGCFPRPVEQLIVATNVWPGYEPLYLARSLGLLPEESVRLVEMSNATDCLDAFRDRLVDCAGLTLDETLTVAQDDPGVRAILVLDTSQGADALVARPEIRSLAELRGKRVGVEQSAVGGYMLARALDAAGLTEQDVQVVPVTPKGQVRDYAEGKLDAVVAYDPSRTLLLKAGAHVLFDSARIPGEVVDLLVAREEVLRGHADQVHQLCQAWFLALAYLEAHPEDAAARMAPRERLSAAEFTAALAGLHFPDEAENRALLAGGLLEPARRLSESMVQRGLLARPVDPANLFAEP